MVNCHIRSLYLCVKDMERAIQFYDNFFEKEVTVKDEVYSIFDINGFRLGLFAFEKKQYAVGLLEHGLAKEQIHSYGFAFEGKKVFIGKT